MFGAFSGTSVRQAAAGQSDDVCPAEQPNDAVRRAPHCASNQLF
ncbi:hypothetical protein ACE4RR_10325 [Alteribacillus sp. HJP-4]